MIGIVIVSHGDLGSAMIKSAELILGTQVGVFSVSVSSISLEVESFRHDIIEKIDEADNGEGVIVLTDLFGGTPSNISISLLGVKNIGIIAGVNLPMVLKLLTIRDQHKDLTISQASVVAAEAGKKQISVASHLVKSH